MLRRITGTLVLIHFITFGCTDDANLPQDPTEPQAGQPSLKLDPNFQYCDSVFIATYPGTACCISGKSAANPGDTLRYHYQMNHRDAQVSWQILEGDISIIRGQGTHTVTVAFGRDFTTGIIIGVGAGIKYDDIPRLRCSDRVIVKSD